MNDGRWPTFLFSFSQSLTIYFYFYFIFSIFYPRIAEVSPPHYQPLTPFSISPIFSLHFFPFNFLNCLLSKKQNPDNKDTYTYTQRKKQKCVKTQKAATDSTCKEVDSRYYIALFSPLLSLSLRVICLFVYSFLQSIC